MRLPEADGRLVETLRALPDLPASARVDVAGLLARAELHGLAGVVHDALTRANVSCTPDLDRELAWREAAREIDHAAHLQMLVRIDEVLVDSGLVAAALKGPLLAERFYPRPAARATSDTDLLVDEADLSAVGQALAQIGYVGAEGVAEERYRREHHHLHFSHDNALPLELHFHAYRGFGRTLPSEPLVARGRTYSAGSLRAIRVLAPADELVFLAVHAAAHRFERLGWLYDLRLLIETLTVEQRMLAAQRATEWGYARAVSFAGELLIDVLGMRAVDVEPIVRRELWRSQLLGAVTSAPRSPLRRSASRFLYSLALCDSPAAALRYSRAAMSGYAARAVGTAP